MSEWEDFTPDDNYQDMYAQYYPPSQDLKKKQVKQVNIKPSGNASAIKIVKPTIAAVKEDKKEPEPEVTTTKSNDPSPPKTTQKDTQYKVISEQFNNMDLKVANEFLELKETTNIVFIGHVDAGKSTLGGQLLIQCGMVDKRTLEKYQREAAEQNRESWYLAWALDLNEDERSKGITVEPGRASFEIEGKKIVILDAPGHKNYVPNMVSAAQEADVGILVISARKGEFESGFEKNGQTREHAKLAKTSGLKKLLILINKMDEETVQWSTERYDDIKSKVKPFLKQCGYGKDDIFFMPVSGFTGANVKDRLDKGVFDHYQGPSFLEYLLNTTSEFNALLSKPFIMPVNNKMKEMGVYATGKILAGTISKGDALVVMPIEKKITVAAIEDDTGEVERSRAGDNIKLKVKGIEEEELFIGHILCHPERLVRAIKLFDAKVAILECDSIIAAGYTAVMHLGLAVCEVTVQTLLHSVDKKTGKVSKKPPPYVREGQQCIMRISVNDHAICAEKFKDVPFLGRFVLRTEDKTIAAGKVAKLLEFQ